MQTFKKYLRESRAGKPQRLITEAIFRMEDLKKVCEKYGSLLAKGLGGAFKIWTTEDFERDGESGSGVRMVNINGNMIRLNFSDILNGYANTKAVVLSSIDYWQPGNVDLECPDVTCRFLQEVNVIQIWKKLADIIFNGQFGKYTAADLGGLNEDIENYGTVRARKDFLTSKGISDWKANSKETFKKTVDQKGLESEWNTYIANVVPGRPETNSTEQRMKKAETNLKKVKYADPDVVFKDIVTLTKELKNTKRKLLTICGMGGLGKTYEVTNTLTSVYGDSPNKDWVYIPAGKFTTLQFFQEVFNARDRIICFDEADNLLTNDEIVTMLKPALDTSGSNQMTYNTGTKPMSDFSKKEVDAYADECDFWLKNGVQFVPGKRFNPRKENVVGSKVYDEDREPTGVWIPSRFFFTGKMIFISNMPMEKIDQALLSRGPKIPVNLTLEGKIARIATVLKNMGYPEKEIDNIMVYLGQQEDSDYISVRTAVAYIDYKKNPAISESEAARLAAMYG